MRPAEASVFGESGLNSHNNIDLPRDAVSLLVVLWALIVLPKRERQAARAANAQGDDQNDMFGKDRPLPTAASVQFSRAASSGSTKRASGVRESPASGTSTAACTDQ